MALLASTKQIIRTVEELTQRPVHIMEDPQLKTLASIIIARGDAPMHVLSYRPAGVMPPDYFVAYQCGFVVRLYNAHPEKRFDVASNIEGRQKMAEALTDSRIPKEVRGMGDYLLDSLITQLRSYPIGLRVDTWLMNGFPELKPLQQNAIKRQLDDNVQALQAGSSGMFPRNVVKANQSMNAAFAHFWSTLWNDSSIILPYKAAGYSDAGARLIALYQTLPDDPNVDLELIDAWALEMGLKQWYAKIPHILNQ